jgi:hypothetical protein
MFQSDSNLLQSKTPIRDIISDFSRGRRFTYQLEGSKETVWLKIVPPKATEQFLWFVWGDDFKPETPDVFRY